MGFGACGDGERAASVEVDTAVAEVDDSAETAPDFAEVAEVAEVDAPAEEVEVEVVEPAPQVVINELDCRADWVELAHVGGPGAAPIALDTLQLSDGSDGVHRLALSGVLVAGGHVAFDLTGFGLACGEEGPVLWRGDLIVAEAPPGNAPEGYTYGRFPDASTSSEANAFVVTEPTRGVVNRVPAADPFDPAGDLFGPLRPVATIELTLPDSSYGSLANDPYTWMPATFAWFEPGATNPIAIAQPVAVRVKGKIGSYRDLNGKTAFKLDFERFWPGAEFHGLQEMTLNNMVQDYNHVNEVLAYDLFRRMRIAVPRASYVKLKVNGEDFGLYLNLEALDGRWRARHFETTLGMFEGEYGDDLFPGSAFYFDLDGGDEAARLPLAALVDAIERAPREGFMDALAAFLDWDEVLRFMATEVFIGHWDGYASTRNNYLLHVDEAGRVRMLPWGLDQTFADDLGFYEGAGLLLRGCVDDPACRVRWEDTLLEVAAVVRSDGYLGWADALAERIQPYIDEEPREDGGDAKSGLQGAWDFLAYRADHLDDVLSCSRDPAADIDGDGHICDEDCDEGDPARYSGARDICGDGIDQDCSGRADDADDCPDCSDEVVDGTAYRFCWHERTFADATTLCEEAGGHLVVMDSAAEVAAIDAAIDARGMGTAWIGLTDLEEEGVFRWVTGGEIVAGVGGFMDGQPDDYLASEDCVQTLPWGGERPWNDLFCDSAVPVVCELD